jgi:hypothetical protein
MGGNMRLVYTEYSGLVVSRIDPDTLLKIAPLFPYAVESPGSWVTVGQPPNTDIGMPNMPSWKAKKLRKLPREKVLLEL